MGAPWCGETVQLLAEMLPGLSETEFRVLVELWRRVSGPGFAGNASQRVLAISTGCGRESVKRALAALERKKFISIRAGATTREGGTPYRCDFLSVLAFEGGARVSPLDEASGLTTTPPPPQISTGVASPSGLTRTPGWTHHESTGPEISTDVDSRSGLTATPVPVVSGLTMSPLDSADAENTQLSLEPELLRARVDRLKDRLKDDLKIDRLQKISTAQAPEERETAILERLLTARPRDFSDAQHARVRSMVMAHVAKFPAPLGEYNRPVDKIITAQLLATSEWHKLDDFFMYIRTNRVQAGESYAWFVVVAVERIHGIQPERLKAAREELRLVKGLPRALAASKGFP